MKNSNHIFNKVCFILMISLMLPLNVHAVGESTGKSLGKTPDVTRRSGKGLGNFVRKVGRGFKKGAGGVGSAAAWVASPVTNLGSGMRTGYGRRSLRNSTTHRSKERAAVEQNQANLRGDTDKLTAASEQAEENLLRATQDQTDLENLLVNPKAELDQLKQQLANLNTKIKNIDSQISKSKDSAEKEALRAERRTYQTEKNDLTNELKRVQRDVNKLTQQIAKAKSTVRAATIRRNLAVAAIGKRQERDARDQTRSASLSAELTRRYQDAAAFELSRKKPLKDEEVAEKLTTADPTFAGKTDIQKAKLVEQYKNAYADGFKKNYAALRAEKYREEMAKPDADVKRADVESEQDARRSVLKIAEDAAILKVNLGAGRNKSDLDLADGSLFQVSRQLDKANSNLSEVERSRAIKFAAEKAIELKTAGMGDNDAIYGSRWAAALHAQNLKNPPLLGVALDKKHFSDTEMAAALRVAVAQKAAGPAAVQAAVAAEITRLRAADATAAANAADAVIVSANESINKVAADAEANVRAGGDLASTVAAARRAAQAAKAIADADASNPNRRAALAATKAAARIALAVAQAAETASRAGGATAADVAAAARTAHDNAMAAAAPNKPIDAATAAIPTLSAALTPADVGKIE